jgi:hypothetical protein
LSEINFDGRWIMPGLKFLNAGRRGFMPVMANDELRAPPPIAILRGKPEIMRVLQAEFAGVERQEKTCCIAFAKPAPVDSVAEQDLMAAVGDRFSRSLRPYDGLLAFEPDLYLIALPHIAEEDTLTVMTRLRSVIVNDPVSVADIGEVSVNLSIGGTMMDASHSLVSNIEHAGRALMLASRGNGVHLWSSEVDGA